MNYIKNIPIFFNNWD